MTDPRLPVSEEQVGALATLLEEAAITGIVDHLRGVSNNHEAAKWLAARGVTLHAVLVPRIERALEAAGRRAFSCSFEGGDYEIHAEHVCAAFWRAMEEK